MDLGALAQSVEPLGVLHEQVIDFLNAIQTQLGEMAKSLEAAKALRLQLSELVQALDAGSELQSQTYELSKALGVALQAERKKATSNIAQLIVSRDDELAASSCAPHQAWPIGTRSCTSPSYRLETPQAGRRKALLSACSPTPARAMSWSSCGTSFLSSGITSAANNRSSLPPGRTACLHS